MTPLAEGIETPGELTFLAASGAPAARGSCSARPQPAEKIPSLLARDTMYPQSLNRRLGEQPDVAGYD